MQSAWLFNGLLTALMFLVISAGGMSGCTISATPFSVEGPAKKQPGFGPGTVSAPAFKVDNLLGNASTGPLGLKWAKELLTLQYDPFLIKIPRAPEEIDEPDPNDAASQSDGSDLADGAPNGPPPPLGPTGQTTVSGISIANGKAIAILKNNDETYIVQPKQLVSIQRDQAFKVVSIKDDEIMLRWLNASGGEIDTEVLQVTDILNVKAPEASERSDTDNTQQTQGQSLTKTLTQLLVE